MTYKTILTYVDDDPASAQRLESAIAEARRYDAHLSVAAMAFEPEVPAYAFGEAVGVLMADIAKQAREQAEALAQVTRQKLTVEGLRFDVSPLTSSYPMWAHDFGLMAQFADLVVLGQPYGVKAEDAAVDALEGALFDGDAAVLVCPETPAQHAPRNILIAWNGSRESIRAVRRALPLIEKAEAVEIAVFDPPSWDLAPGEALATMLARRGLAVTVQIRPSQGERVSEALRQRLVELGADLLVMGAYSHSRFREYILGGVTREMLEDVTIPVLMAH